MLAESHDLREGDKLAVTGYVRGGVISADRLVHIPGLGDFLEGKVIQSLEKYRTSLLSNPLIMVKSWSNLQKRTELLVRELARESCASGDKLIRIWDRDLKFLISSSLPSKPSCCPAALGHGPDQEPDRLVKLHAISASRLSTIIQLVIKSNLLNSGKFIKIRLRMT